MLRWHFALRTVPSLWKITQKWRSVFRACNKLAPSFAGWRVGTLVVLAVDRLGGKPIDEAFRTGLLAHMEQFRMAGYDLEVCEPVAVPLDIVVHVCLRPGTSRTAVHRELQERLGSGRRGLFHPDRLTFGQRIYASQILAQAAAVAGVDHARMVRFKRLRDPAGTELDDGYLEVSGIEMPQLANEASFPERGTIGFELEGGI